MRYIVYFVIGSMSNSCFFDNEEDAVEFAKHLASFSKIKGVAIHTVEYSYPLTNRIVK